MSFLKIYKLSLGMFAIAGILTLTNCGKKSEEVKPDKGMPEAAAKVDTKVLSSCKPCHFLDKDQSQAVKGFGPGLKGIFNSKPVTAGIPFSAWDEASLDKWLTNPKEIKPDTKMTLKIADQEKRKNIISALKQL